MSAPQKLSPDEVEQFRNEGLLKIDYIDLVGREVFEGLTQALREAEAAAAAAGVDEGNCQPELFLRLVHLCETFPEVAAAVRSPRVGEMAAQLAGVPHVRSWLDETFFKPPGSQPCVWHQDLPHLPMDRKGLLTFWIAIDDVTPEMGPVHYLPRSNRLGPLGRATNSDSRKSLDELTASYRGIEDPEVYLYEGDRERVGDIVSFSLRAGEAVIHDGLTLHGSPRNLSSRVRRGWACVYFPSESQYTGMPRLESDGLGLEPFRPFEHSRFPVIA